VAPERIENVYVQSRYVQQVYVDGDSLERSVVFALLLVVFLI
jgi:long-subunit acyl-CoA synthetase (AMP-forming)